MNRLENKVALITGAGNGIGEVTAKLFVEEGASVVICDINEEDGNRVQAEIEKDFPGKAIFQKVDVSKEADWEACIAATKAKFGKVNIVVNNAGVSFRETVAELDMDIWNKTVGVNQLGVALGMKYGIAAMRENGEPCAIVSTCSVDGLCGDSVFFTYCATKAAVEAMTKCAALYCCDEKLNIRVNAVAPGYILTPMAEEDARQNGQTLEEYSAEAGAMHPMGRLGMPIDIAKAYLYMVSDDAAFTTGTTLAVDGGYCCI